MSKQERMEMREFLRARKEQRALEKRFEYERIRDGLRLEHRLSFQK